MSNSDPNKPVARSGQKPGASESKESLETFPERSKRPGEAGLANESRPGLGTRGVTSDSSGAARKSGRRSAPKSKIAPPPEERREPSEQDAASLEQELQRDTGMSGQSSGV